MNALFYHVYVAPPMTNIQCVSNPHLFIVPVATLIVSVLKKLTIDSYLHGN